MSDVLYYKKKEKNNHPQNLSVETQKGKKYPQILAKMLPQNHCFSNFSNTLTFFFFYSAKRVHTGTQEYI